MSEPVNIHELKESLELVAFEMRQLRKQIQEYMEVATMSPNDDDLPIEKMRLHLLDARCRRILNESGVKFRSEIEKGRFCSIPGCGWTTERRLLQWRQKSEEETYNRRVRHQ